MIYEASRGSFFELRTFADPRSIVPAVRKIVADVDSDMTLFDVTTESAQVFGLLAMALACIGLYSLLPYETSQRTHEIGVRMALGARPKNVFRLILGRGSMLTFMGAVTGIGGALVLTRFLRSLLFEIQPTDPATFVAVAILLTVVTLLA